MAFCLATANAAGLISTAVIFAVGSFFAAQMAMMPLPVPMSMIRGPLDDAVCVVS